MKVILDVDPGIDDTVAMGQVLSRKDDIEILGITCVAGNVGLDQVVKNTLKIIEAFGRKDLKVFKGASRAIIESNWESTETQLDGTDGLCCAVNCEPDMAPLQEEHAVSAINRLARTYSGEMTLIALGPLTNVALALRLNENLASELKEIVIMGGNYKGEGNITMAAEFNFFVDPIAARIVLGGLYCPKYLVTWELTKQHYLTVDDIHQYISHDNTKSKFMKKLFEARKIKRNYFCDSVAVAVATNREIILKSFFKYATVDIESSLTKGMVVIGWNLEIDQTENKGNAPNVIIVDEINTELYRKLFLDSTK